MSDNFQKRKEKTSTYLSLRYLGHCNNLLASDSNEYSENISSFMELILLIHSSILNATKGISTPINCWMIYKLILLKNERSNQRIDCIRVRNKFENICTFILKSFGII